MTKIQIKCFRNRLTKLVAGFLSFLSYAVASPYSPLSLEEAYNLALAKSEGIQISEVNTIEAIERYNEAYSALFPKLSLGAGQTFRDKRDRVSGSTSASSEDTHHFETYLTVTQPLFAGFRHRYAAEAAEADVRSKELLKEWEKRLLYLDLADLYLQAVSLQNQGKELKETERVIQERIRELTNWIDLGKSKESDVLASRADLADASANTVRVSGAFKATKELLSFLIGLESKDFTLPSNAKIKFPPGSPNVYLDAIPNRPDIQAYQKAVLAQKNLVEAERGSRLPEIYLNGNYFTLESPDHDKTWDATVNLGVPIFDFGEISARIGQREAAYKRTQLEYERALRQASRDVKQLSEDLTAKKEELSLLRKLTEDARLNYESQKRDFELGIVNNLEVLQALRTMQESRLRVISAEASLEITRAKLAIYGGAAPDEPA